MNANENPVVFISHASEDKERFVMKFAEKLISDGVNAWVDKWEMLPGDSLVDKIFEEGLKNAQAIIVVLSTSSVDKPWVKEEINAAFVNKINSKCRIIPILLDEVAVPECLQSTVWENVTDINNYEEKYKRILASIYGHSLKPKLGQIPNYVKCETFDIPNLNKIDCIVLDELCKFAIEKNQNSFLEGEMLLEKVKEKGVSSDLLEESLDILFRNHYIKGIQTIDGKLHQIKILTYGLDVYIKHKVPEFDKIVSKIGYYIINDYKGNLEYAIENNISSVVVEHAFNILEERGLIKTQRTISGNIIIVDISPQLKRMLEN